MISTGIPFVDLSVQHRALRGELEAAIAEVIDASAFAGGPMVARFEEEFGAFCGSRQVIGVGSGTEALWLSLLALGIGVGDEVITVSNSFIATAEAISFASATPVFVDVDASTCTMDPTLLARAITPRTKAIIPVHLFGHPADMDSILKISRQYNIPVIEDACQGHGAKYRGRYAGTFGATGCFSFYPGKNLGSMGDAGAIVTDDAELADKLRRMRNHGQTTKYRHVNIGWNARMDGIQAAVLRVKLRHLGAWNDARRRHAAAYRLHLTGAPGILLPTAASYADPAWHLYCIRVRERDAVLQAMTDADIVCGIHYPVPIHLQEAYGALGLRRGSLPVTERLSEELLSLPLYPELTRVQLERVAKTLRKIVTHLAVQRKCV